MAKNSISYLLDDDYVGDPFTNTELNITGRINYPRDFSDQNARDIVAAIGGVVTRLNGVDEPNRVQSPCPSANNLTPRKLIFTRANGNSFSVILPTRGALIAVRDAIVNIVDGIGTANGNVVCVTLQGERWDDLIRDFGAGANTPTSGTAYRPDAGIPRNAIYYRGNYTYQTDFPANENIVKRFKIATSGDGNPVIPPPGLEAPIAACLGNVILGDAICPASEDITPRRYVLTTQTTATDGTTIIAQDTEVPVADDNQNGIQDCGSQLAATASALCLSYFGESQTNVL